MDPEVDFPPVAPHPSRTALTVVGVHLQQENPIPRGSDVPFPGQIPAFFLAAALKVASQFHFVLDGMRVPEHLMLNSVLSSVAGPPLLAWLCVGLGVRLGEIERVNHR